MKRTTTTLLTLAGLVFAAGSTADTPPSSKEGYELAQTKAEAQFKIDDAACSALKSNAKDICTAQAKGAESVAKADAEAAFDNTAKNREAARLARTDAIYAVSLEKCDDLAGNTKDVCVKVAKADQIKGHADANVDRVTSDTRRDAATKQSDARSEAVEDTTTAEFDVAVEKCDALAGQAKDDCVGNAKARFGK